MTLKCVAWLLAWRENGFGNNLLGSLILICWPEKGGVGINQEFFGDWRTARNVHTIWSNVRSRGCFEHVPWKMRKPKENHVRVTFEIVCFHLDLRKAKKDWMDLRRCLQKYAFSKANVQKNKIEGPKRVWFTRDPWHKFYSFLNWKIPLGHLLHLNQSRRFEGLRAPSLRACHQVLLRGSGAEDN